MNKKVLVLFAHPTQRHSEVNIPLFKVASSVEGVTVVDLYAEYPTYQIDIDREQERLKLHDVVIFQYPLYWYSTPAILKEWQDQVLEYGFAYGLDDLPLKGKCFMCAISAGGEADAYKKDGNNKYNIREILSPLEEMASLTGMLYLAPFCLFDTDFVVKERQVGKHVRSYYNLLMALVTGNIDIDLALKSRKLTSSNLDSVLK